jgi:hypothetical protein
MTEFRKPYPPLKAVKRTLAVFAVALFAISLAATGATAATKPEAKTARAAATNPAVAECFKRSGGTYNPVTKRWAIFGDEGNMIRSNRIPFANALAAPQGLHRAR